MRGTLCLVITACTPSLSGAVPADEAAEAKALLDKAIEALGGAEKLDDKPFDKP